MTESARAEAFASQADRSRELAAQHLQQTIATVGTFRALRDNITRMLAEQKIEFRWVDTRLDLMGPLGEWVPGPDLRGVRGVRGPAIELRLEAGKIEWRPAETDDDWVSLLDIAEQVDAAEQAASAAVAARNVSTSAATVSDGAATAAIAARDLSRLWAAEDVDVEVAGGGFSSKHYAAKARQSAEEAATFDPDDFYTSVQVDNALADKADIAALATKANVADLAGKADLVDGRVPLSQLQPSPLLRVSRTANTTLSASDVGNLIDITSGTFTQTFATPAALGVDWWCYVRNAGDGDITIPTSDGRTNWIMYPAELRLFMSDGTTLRSIVIRPFYKVFTASATFIKPPGYERLGGSLNAGGAGGGTTASTTAGTGRGGGGGGGAVPLDLLTSVIADSENIVIGAGGTAGSNGGNTTFAGHAARGGLSASSLGGNASVQGIMLAGPFGPSEFSVAQLYGGGSGVANTNSNPFSAADSGVYGGGGGGGRGDGGALLAPGSSAYAGAGGADNTAGSAPSGGGGRLAPGARGEAKIWGVL